MLIYLPGILKNEISVQRNGTHVDFAPTLFYLLNIPLENKWQGQSLLGNKYDSRINFFIARSSNILNGLIDGNLKYFFNLSTKEEKLFDLYKDKEEINDLSSSNKEKIKYYKNLLNDWNIYQENYAQGYD